MWNPDFCTSINSLVGERWVMLEGLYKLCDWTCTIVVVCRGYSLDDQRLIHLEVNQAKNIFNSPLMIPGYFNQVLQILIEEV